MESLNISITQIIAFYILIASVAYFILNLPSILPIINVILSVLYSLFVYNIIRFKFDPRSILFGILLIILGLSTLQLLKAKRKFAVVAVTLEIMACLTAMLVYLKLISSILKY